MIPVYIAPYPDEFLYSWIFRMAKANRLSLSCFYSGYLGMRNAKISSLPIDVRQQFPRLLDSLWVRKKNVRDMYLSLTTFSFESMFMTLQHKTKYIGNIFYSKDAVNSTVNSVVREIRICPECVKEDNEKYGEAYLHRSHLLSGVCTCHKHGCMLHRYLHGANEHACDFDMEQYSPVTVNSDTDALRAYTGYAIQLFHIGGSCDIRDIKDVLVSAIKNHGHTASDNYASLVSRLDEWRFKSLINYNVPHFLKVKLIGVNYIKSEEILPLLMYFYPEAPSLEGKSLVSVTCPVCGYEYFEISGSNMPCPGCEYKTDTQENYERLVSSMSNGKYVPVGDFGSMNEPSLFREIKTGKMITVKPRALLFEQNPDKRIDKLLFEDAKEKVESHKGFRLIEFKNSDNPVTILHEGCGHAFSCMYHKFLSFPGCRYCKPSFMTAELFRERVRALVGDEYSVVTDFTSQKAKVRLKHSVCGLEQDYLPRHFLDGQRCKACSKMIHLQKLQEMLDGYSDGLYRITETGKNAHTITNTRTGETIRLSRTKILQEILRPTPSPILPI